MVTEVEPTGAVGRPAGTQELDTGKRAFQIVVPPACTHHLWEDYHQAAGHASGEKVLSMLRQLFFWPGMGADVDRWTK